MSLEIKSLAVRISVAILTLNISIERFCNNPGDITRNSNFGILGLSSIPV